MRFSEIKPTDPAKRRTEITIETRRLTIIRTRSNDNSQANRLTTSDVMEGFGKTQRHRTGINRFRATYPSNPVDFSPFFLLSFSKSCGNVFSPVKLQNYLKVLSNKQ